MWIGGGVVYIEREFIQNPLSSWEWIKNEGKIHNIVGSATFSNYVCLWTIVRTTQCTLFAHTFCHYYTLDHLYLASYYHFI
jgi:hypothetical protein